jgi:hypothetical protein
MKWAIGVIVVIAILAIVGWKQSQLSGSQTSPKISYGAQFRLDVEVAKSNLPVIRGSGEETTYTYSRVVEKQVHELWRITLREKYRAHWIDPSGNVWVFAGISQRAGPSAQLWIRDPLADVRARISPSALAQSHARQPFDIGTIDEKRATMRQLTSLAYQLELPTKGGSMFVTAMNGQPEVADTYVVDWRPSGNPSAPFEKFLQEPGGPRVMSVHPDLPHWQLWTEERPYAPAVLTIGPDLAPSSDKTVHYVLQQRSFQIAPAQVVRTPNRRYLWFTYGLNEQPKEASIEIFDRKGNSLGKVDWLEAGRFDSVYAAQHEVDVANPAVRQGGREAPMSTAPPTGWDKPEFVIFSATKNRKFELKIPAHGDSNHPTLRSFADESGFVAKEPRYPDHAQTAQKTFASADGQFEMRLRVIRDAKGSQSAVRTLIKKGEGMDHEFWTQTTPYVPLDVLVSNSGRVFAIEILPGEGDRPAMALLSMRRADAQTPVSLDLTRSDFYGSMDAAKQANFKDLKIEYVGPKGVFDFEGEALPTWSAEQLHWQLTPTKKRVLTLSPMGPGMVDRIYWSEKPK